MDNIKVFIICGRCGADTYVQYPVENLVKCVNCGKDLSSIWHLTDKENKRKRGLW